MTAPDLLARLRAVLDEAERVAKAAKALAATPWALVHLPHEVWPEGIEIEEGWEVHAGDKPLLDPEDTPDLLAHIAAWSPDVALRMVEATREVLDRHTPYDHEYPDLGCVHCSREYAEAWPCPHVLTEAKRWGVES